MGADPPSEVNAEARSFGIEVVDVRIRRADLPEENSQAILSRMQSEREREARRDRARRRRGGPALRANAERERTVILAEAQREPQIAARRGRAGGDPILPTPSEGQGILPFYRSMQAYRDALRTATPPACCARTASSSAISAGCRGERRPRRGDARRRGAEAAPRPQCDPADAARGGGAAPSCCALVAMAGTTICLACAMLVAASAAASLAVLRSADRGSPDAPDSVAFWPGRLARADRGLPLASFAA